jgi:hypothetical protein
LIHQTSERNMTTGQIIETLLPSAIDFLARKHGVAAAAILDALAAGNERIAEQLADLMATAYEAHKAA